MTKFIWATDIAQFEVDELSLKKFTAFNTKQEAYQDAVNHFNDKIFDDCEIIIYTAELEYDDLSEKNFFHDILTEIETEAFQDYSDYDLDITTIYQPSSLEIKYNDELKKLICNYLTEIGKEEDIKYPHIVNVQTQKIINRGANL